MSKTISAYGVVRRFNADGEKISGHEDGFELSAAPQNCGDCNVIITTDGVDCNNKVYMHFTLSQDNIDELIAKLQACKSQKVKWDEQYGNK